MRGRNDAQDLRGVISAREFVWWFNGHPDAAQLPVDLSKVPAAPASPWLHSRKTHARA